MDYTHVEHTFGPVYDENSTILIIGSFPSVKSREMNFYYGHPQNRFWKVLEGLLYEDIPNTIEGKKEFLLRHHIALWDVIESCDIMGSSDNSIKNVVTNDIGRIISYSNITKICANGDKAYKLFMKYCNEEVKKVQVEVKVIKLLSTSPANASYTLEMLVSSWREAIGSKE